MCIVVFLNIYIYIHHIFPFLELPIPRQGPSIHHRKPIPRGLCGWNLLQKRLCWFGNCGIPLTNIGILTTVDMSGYIISFEVENDD